MMLSLKNTPKNSKNRLSHREISPELTEYEILTTQLLNECLKLANKAPKEDYTCSEVEIAIRQLKNGKAADPNMFPPEIFKHAGKNLIDAITNILNQIKNCLEIPESWIQVIIIALYKNKGARKLLKNHRGIFLTAILAKVMERLIKTRSKNELNNINPCQYGGKADRSPADCIYIIRSLIDHSLYLKNTLYLNLYDYSTCFDSLWLEDTMLSLWDIGIQNDRLALIYKMNEQSSITIRTPYGNSTEFSCPRIVKQGAVLSTTLCGSSTGQLGESLDTTDETGATVGSVVVRSVMFVDDTTTVNNKLMGSINSHHTVTSFARRKRLHLNIPKSVQLIINHRQPLLPPQLVLGNDEINSAKCTKYVGDYISSNGCNKELIYDRVKKAKGIVVSALALCNDITLGHHYVRSSILLYKCIFLSSTLFNSQAWTHITQTQLKDLQTVQLKYFKRMLKTPDATSNVFTFLELGLLPIEFEIHKRQLIFLHHILHLPPDETVLQIYHQQLKFTFEHNWANNTKMLLCKYKLDNVDVSSISKSEWKLLATSAINDFAFKWLKSESTSMKKTSSLQYESFETREYLLTCPADVALFIFRLRSRTLNCKDNHHKSHINLTCRWCHVEIETQDHIINCCTVFPNEPHLLLEEFRTSNFAINVYFVRKIMDRYTMFHQYVPQ